MMMRRDPRALHVSSTFVSSAFAASSTPFEQTLFLRSVSTVSAHFLFNITVPCLDVVVIFHRGVSNLRRWW